jgi:hypothetical protein
LCDANCNGPIGALQSWGGEKFSAGDAGNPLEVRTYSLELPERSHFVLRTNPLGSRLHNSAPLASMRIAPSAA